MVASTQPQREIRNIGILAHIDAGKTTLTEQLLYLTGAIGYVGSVEQGTTAADWLVQEQQRGITIGSAALTCHWQGHAITIVDTPGHVDFTMEVERSLRVIDGAVVVLSGPEGVQAQTETVWHQAAARAVPVIGFVNKLDREGFDDAALQEEVRQRLGIEPLPLQLVTGSGGPEIRLIDLLADRALSWDACDRKAGARMPRISALEGEEPVLRQIGLERIVDTVASHDDDFAEQILEGRNPGPADWLRAVRNAVRHRGCLPLVYGVARAGAGLEGVADSVVSLLPAPDEAPPQRAYDLITGELVGASAGGGPGDVRARHEGPAAFVFKTEPRRFGRRLAYLRVFAGAIAPGVELVRYPHGEVYVPDELVCIMGGSEEPIDRLGEGMIGGLLSAGDGELPRTGETLAVRGFPVAYEPIFPPASVISVVVEAPDPESDRRMRHALAAFGADDPSLFVSTDPSTGQCLLSGMGELHLELAVERLRQELGKELRAGTPRATLRHLVVEVARGSGHVEPGAGGGFVEVDVLLRPRSETLTTDFSFACTPPRRADHRAALEAGLERGLGTDGAGVRRLIGAELSVLRVESKGVDVSPVHFRDAAARAVEDALAGGGAVEAEPWMRLSVVVPGDRVGAVVGDLSRRRARVSGSEARGTLQVLAARAPLRSMIGYATDLRSLTGGRGLFTMEPAGYEPI